MYLLIGIILSVSCMMKAFETDVDIKKILNPLTFFLLGLVLLLISLGHLMYGHCQSSKYHYIVQRFYMPKYLPKSMWRENYIHEPKNHLFGALLVDKNFSGRWSRWSAQGKLVMSTEMISGIKEGLQKRWWNDGSRESVISYADGRLHGEWRSWHRNGNVSSIILYENNKEISGEHWDENGLEKTTPFP